MIINEEKYAAAYWTEAGEARRFDDIGGMMATLGEAPEAVASYWVHDFDSGAWLPAEDATFVLAGDLMTPMGFGIVAFATEAQAQSMVMQHESGRVVSFDQLLDMPVAMPAGQMKEMSARDEQ
jgi:copper chaperone NosL